MKILSFDEFKSINESITLKAIEEGMVVVYSKNGKETNYQYWICLTDKENIKKYVDSLKWNNDITDADRKRMKGMSKILVAHYNGSCDYIEIDDVLINNISYIYNPKLKPKDMLDKNTLKDLRDECSDKNLIYSKDVDLKNMVLSKPDVPFMNYGLRLNDYMGVSRGEMTYDLGGVYGVRY